MLISGFTCILGVLFLCEIQRAIIKNIWQKFPIASTMGVTESVRRISFGAGIANHMKLGSIIIRKDPLHIPDSLYVPELYIANQETIARSCDYY